MNITDFRCVPAMGGILYSLDAGTSWKWTDEILSDLDVAVIDGDHVYFRGKHAGIHAFPCAHCDTVHPVTEAYLINEENGPAVCLKCWTTAQSERA